MVTMLSKLRYLKHNKSAATQKVKVFPVDSQCESAANWLFQLKNESKTEVDWMVLEQFIAKDAFRNIKVSSSVLLSCIWAALKGKPDIQHIGLGLFLIGGFLLQTTNHRRRSHVGWLRLSGGSESFLRAQASTK